MLLDYADNSELLDYLENAKAELHTHFEQNYKCRLPTPTTHEPSGSVQSMADNAPVVNFMARYRQAPRAPANELDEYFKLSHEDIDTCDLIKWWHGRRSQFPNLFKLARDLFS
ncbi:hypothetical protein H0H92_002494, partial [Tricholoma furcatifolium]